MKTRLEKIMESHNVTREELMRELTKTAYNRLDNNIRLEVMSKFEEGRAIPNCLEIRTLKDICKICNCSADYLLGLSDVMDPMDLVENRR